MKGRIKQLAVDAGYENVSVADAAGRTWQSGDIYATARHCLVTLMFAVLCFFVMVRLRYDPLA